MIAEELKLVISADVNAALNNLLRFQSATKVAKDDIKGFNDAVSSAARGTGGANFRALGGQIDEVGESMDETTGSADLMQSAMKGLAKGAGALLTWKTFVKYFNAANKAFADSEMSAIRFESGLEGAQSRISLTSDQLKEMARQLAWTSGIEDDTVINTQALLMSFDEIGRTVFPRALDAASKLSIFLQQDMQTSALQLGRALQSPKDSLGALSRAGIKFTEDEKAMIEAMVDAGDVIGAQTMILDTLDKAMKPLLEKVGESGVTAFSRFSNAINNFLELQGKFNTNVLGPLANGLAAVIELFTRGADAALDFTGALFRLDFRKAFGLDKGEQSIPLQDEIDTSDPKARKRLLSSLRSGSGGGSGGNTAFQVGAQMSGGYVSSFEAATAAISDYNTELGISLSDLPILQKMHSEHAEAVDKQRDTYAKAYEAIAPYSEALGMMMVNAAEGAEAMKNAIKGAISSMLQMLAKKAFVEAMIAFGELNIGMGSALLAASMLASTAAGVVQAMAEGGVVTGPTHALIGESGPEAVIPLDKMGGFGTHIHYHIAGNMMREEEFYRRSHAYSQGAQRGY